MGLLSCDRKIRDDSKKYSFSGIFFIVLLLICEGAALELYCYACTRDSAEINCDPHETCNISSQLYMETVCLKLVVDHTHGKEKVHRTCETEKLQEDLCQIKKDMLEREHLEMISCSVCGMNLCNIGNMPSNHSLYLLIVTLYLLKCKKILK